jgi:hypothetical protein
VLLSVGHYTGTGILFRGNGTEWGNVHYEIEVRSQGLPVAYLEPLDGTAPAEAFAEFRRPADGETPPKLRMADTSELWLGDW